MFDKNYWKKVWQHLDLELLIKFKRVNKEWYSGIDNFIQQKDWFIKHRRLTCRPPLFSLWEEIGYKNDFFLLHKNWRLWRKCFKKAVPHLLLDRAFALNQVTDESFSCIVTQGDILGVATKSGELFFYHLSDHLVSKENFKAFYRLHSFSGFRKMKIWQPVGSLQAIVQCDNDILKIFDLESGREIINNVFFGSVFETSGGLLYLARCVNEDWFLEIFQCEGRPYMRSRASIPYDGGVIPLNFMKLYAEGRIVSMISITEYTSDLCIVKFVDDDEGIELNEIVQSPSSIDFAHINCVYMFDSCIFATTEDDLLICIDTRHWKTYMNVSEHLGANIKSIGLHADVLFLGLANGELHIFFLETILELARLRLNSQNKRVIPLCKEPINAISFAIHQDNRYISVMTTSKVFLFHL